MKIYFPNDEWGLRDARVMEEGLMRHPDIFGEVSAGSDSPYDKWVQADLSSLSNYSIYKRSWCHAHSWEDKCSVISDAIEELDYLHRRARYRNV